MRLLREILEEDKMYYMESNTNSVRKNNGIVLSKDSIFQRIGINVLKYEYHIPVAEMIIKSLVTVKN